MIIEAKVRWGSGVVRPCQHKGAKIDDKYFSGRFDSFSLLWVATSPSVQEQSRAEPRASMLVNGNDEAIFQAINPGKLFSSRWSSSPLLTGSFVFYYYYFRYLSFAGGARRAEADRNVRPG